MSPSIAICGTPMPAIGWRSANGSGASRDPNGAIGVIRKRRGNHPMVILCSPADGSPCETRLHHPCKDMWGADWTEVEVEPSGIRFNPGDVRLDGSVHLGRIFRHPVSGRLRAGMGDRNARFRPGRLGAGIPRRAGLAPDQDGVNRAGAQSVPCAVPCPVLSCPVLYCPVGKSAGWHGCRVRRARRQP